VQQSDHLTRSDAAPLAPVEPQPRTLPKVDWQEARRYLMMRPVVCGALVVLLLLHLVWPARFDLATLVLLGGLYLLAIGSGGLEAARLSGAGGADRRQERLAEDALKRAGRLQSHLDPGTASDDVVHRILAGGGDARRTVILSGNEVEDALRAVYRHFSEAERLAGTSNGTDLPLPFLVQELIWRGLLPPDIYETAEPILSLREMAQSPRAQISPQIAGDAARATQAVVLRVQSLGIEIHPQRRQLTWRREEPESEPPSAPETPLPAEPAAAEPDLLEDGQIVDGDRLNLSLAAEPTEASERDDGRIASRTASSSPEPSDTRP
jgi:hypothetical protein